MVFARTVALLPPPSLTTRKFVVLKGMMLVSKRRPLGNMMRPDIVVFETFAVVVALEVPELIPSGYATIHCCDAEL
jgi:hypothetical protein